MAMNSAMFGQQMSGALGAAAPKKKKGKKGRKPGFIPGGKNAKGGKRGAL